MWTVFNDDNSCCFLEIGCQMHIQYYNIYSDYNMATESNPVRLA